MLLSTPNPTLVMSHALVSRLPALEFLIAIVVQPVARAKDLLKPSEGFSVHILQQERKGNLLIPGSQLG